MTDDEFADLEILAKSRVIQGANEKTLRQEFAAKGLGAADVDRVVATVDFGRQNDQRRRNRLYRLMGLASLLIGAVWQGYLLVAYAPSRVFSELAIGMVLYGLWFVTMGEAGVFWRRRRRVIRIGRDR